MRHHDELSIELYEEHPEIQKKMFAALSSKGEPFGEGLALWWTLGQLDPRRINLSNAILHSLPGLPLMYYGDEIGEGNNPDFMREAAQEREKQLVHSGVKVKSCQDARDIGHAPISKERLFNAMNHPNTQEGQLFQQTKRIIAVRKQEPALVKDSLKQVRADQDHIFSYLRECDHQRVVMAHNLSEEGSTVRLSLPEEVLVMSLLPDGPKDLLSDRSIAVKPNMQNNTIELTLKPYESLWLKLPQTTTHRSNQNRAAKKNGFGGHLFGFIKQTFKF